MCHWNGLHQMTIKKRKTIEKVVMSKMPMVKGTEATCVEIASETKKWFKLKDKLNFNVL